MTWWIVCVICDLVDLCVCDLVDFVSVWCVTWWILCVCVICDMVDFVCLCDV